MKIAYITNAFPILSETFVVEQIVAAMKAGHDVDIYSYQKIPQPFLQPTVKEYQLLEKTIYLEENVKNLHTHLTSKKYDVIHCQFGKSYIFLQDIVQKLQRNGSKIVVSFYGYDYSHFPVHEGLDVYDHLFTHANQIIVISNYIKKFLISLGCKKEIIKIPLGIDLKKFQYMRRKTQQPIKILFLSRMDEKKGAIFLLEALQLLHLHGYRFEATFAGGGPFEQFLQDICRDWQVPNVKFVGTVNEIEVKELMSSHDVFILPAVISHNMNIDGQAKVLQEAQATGLPVIATLTNGIPEGVVANKTGFLVEAKNIIALFEKIRYFIENPTKLEQFGKNARSFVEKNFDQVALSKQLLEVYKV